MGKDRFREDTNHELNMKKVIAVIVAIIVIAMAIIMIAKVVKSNNNSEKAVALTYYTVYEDGKWGVINSKGETVITPTYDEMIIIPDPEKDVFVVTYDVDYENSTYKSKAINSKNQQLFSDYDSVEVIQNQNSQNSVWYCDSCLKVEKDNKYGLIDFSGKKLLECQYDSINPIIYIKNSLITEKDGKKGLVSTTGTIIINNEYDEITALTNEYEDGYIVKNSENKYGVIGTNKKTLVPVQYDEIKNVHSDTKYVVKKSGTLNIFDSSDNSEIAISADDVKSIDGDNIIIKSEDKYGLINTAGEKRIDAKYQDLTYTFGSYYIAKNNDMYGIVDANGDTKLDFKYSSLIYRKDADFIEGQTTGNVNSDIIDRNLTVKLTGIISDINITKGYVKIRIDSDYKYYNFKFEEKKNTEILTDNTLFLDKKDGKYGYVDKNGVVKVNYIYDDGTEQNDCGYVSVKKDGKWGSIDSNGNIVLDPSVDLSNNTMIDFIGTWHLSEDANANFYTK